MKQQTKIDAAFLTVRTVTNSIAMFTEEGAKIEVSVGGGKD
ncbi:MAG: hypothetical protein ACRD8Z_22700 [Nitrososphaeraceae archaeon]